MNEDIIKSEIENLFSKYITGLNIEPEVQIKTPSFLTPKPIKIIASIFLKHKDLLKFFPFLWDVFKEFFDRYAGAEIMIEYFTQDGVKVTEIHKNLTPKEIEEFRRQFPRKDYETIAITNAKEIAEKSSVTWPNENYDVKIILVRTGNENEYNRNR